LFRKIGNRSSEFYPGINEVRQDGGSYIYEEFVETQVRSFAIRAVLLGSDANIPSTHTLLRFPRGWCGAL